MAVYPNMVITSAGQTLYGKVQSGTQLTFTRMQIGSGQLASSAQLSAALVSGTAYTSLSVNALSGAIASGSTIVIGTGATTQTVTTSAYAAPGDTTISVNSFTANADYAIGTSLAVTQNQPSLTGLITPIDYITINSISTNNGTANILAIYQNTNLTASTYTCEIGLYAQDPTAGEILYAYSNAGSQGDTIPPYADGPYSRQFQISTAIGSATSVTANIPSNTYIPVSQKAAANGVATLDGNSQVPANQLGNVPALPTDLARTDQANTFTANQTVNAILNATTLQQNGHGVWDNNNLPNPAQTNVDNQFSVSQTIKAFLSSITGDGTSTGQGQIAVKPVGGAQGQLGVYTFYSTFEGTTDNGQRRTADIVAGFNGGAWGSEYLSFNVGGATDSANLTAEQMRLTSNGLEIIGPSLTVGGQEVLAGSVIKSVQRGTVALTATSVDVTINSVDTSKAMVNLIGANTGGQSSTYNTIDTISAQLTSSTILQFNCGSSVSSEIASWEVIEYV